MDSINLFDLHPGLIDAALQASIALLNTSEGILDQMNGNPPMPFALQEVQIVDHCVPVMWALIRKTTIKPFVQNSVESNLCFDIDLLNEKGNVCLRIIGLQSRRTNATSDKKDTLINATPVWESIAGFPSRSSLSSDTILIIGNANKAVTSIQSRCANTLTVEISPDLSIHMLIEKFKTLESFQHIFWIAPDTQALSEEAMIAQQEDGVLFCFRLVKALLQLGYGSEVLGLTFITFQSQSTHQKDIIFPCNASIHGLIGALAKEYQNWKVRLLDLEYTTAQIDNSALWDDIFVLPENPMGNAFAYRNKTWHEQKLVPVKSLQRENTQSIYKKNGVYVIIGGAGGIGTVWSKYMIDTYEAQIIWIGRRKEDAAIREKIQKLNASGKPPVYISADATDFKSLQSAYTTIKDRYNHINGVIHSAIVLLDQSLVKMEETQFCSALKAKIDVGIRMAQVFGQESLDFMLFFSSLNAFTKAPGQSNYASGCTFKDAFAHWLRQSKAFSHIRTVKVVNWGYWGSVGIVASKEYQDRMEDVGLGSIEPDEAMETLEMFLSGPLPQIAVLKTKGAISKAVSSMASLDTEASITLLPGIFFPSTIPNIENSIKANLPVAPDQQETDRHPDNTIRKEMEKLLADLLLVELQRAGWQMGEAQTDQALRRQIHLIPLYNRWFEETMAILSQRKLLECHRETIRMTKNTSVEYNKAWEVWNEKKTIWQSDTCPLGISIKAQVTLVESMLRSLPAILCGKTAATEVMFPNASMERVEGIYKNSPVSDYFNEVLAQVILAYIEQTDSKKIRILEIGAGTGGTSAMIFHKLQQSHLQDRVAEYCYTDLSPAFMQHAEQVYGPQNPCLKCRIFDVEKPLTAQGMDLGSYDLVVATNVLHATRNICATLSNAKAALKQNGLLLLNEISGNMLFTHLTFGLLEGWWLYEDPDLRIQGCPGLSSKSWQKVLEQEGLGSVFFPVQQSHILGQQIIVAESDGVVREKRLSFSNKLHREKIKNSNKVLAESFTNNQKKHSAKVENQPRPLPLAQKKSKNVVTDKMIVDHIQMTIYESIAEALKMEIENIHDQQSFSEYGVDSIVAVKLVNTLNKYFAIPLQTTILFDYNNVTRLTQHIFEKHKQDISLLLEGNIDTKASEPLAQEGEENYLEAEITDFSFTSRLEDASVNNPPINIHKPLPTTPQTFSFSSQASGSTYSHVCIKGPGSVDDLYLAQSPIPPLKNNEVRVAVKAFSLNFGDLLCVKGLYPTMPPYPFTPGFEATGTVIEKGSAVSTLATGDEVIVLTRESLGGSPALSLV